MAYNLSIQQEPSRIHPERIPAEMRALPQWVCWRYETRDGNPTKVPYRARGWGRASSIDPETWGTFEQALKAMERHQHDGIGFMFAGDWVGVDIDKCLDPDTGIRAPWAIELLVHFAQGAYMEISPSGTGIHIIGKGQIPGKRNKTTYQTGAVELYDATSPRFFTVTGNALPETSPPDDISAGLATVYQMVFPPEPAPPPLRVLPSLTLDDQRVLELAFRASNGAETRRLYDGDKSGCGDDHSGADLALQSRLAFYTQDPDQLDRLHRGSGLYRKKWERADYRERTIGKALQQRETYNPSRPTALPERETLPAAHTPEVAALQARIEQLERDVAAERERADRAEEIALRAVRLEQVLAERDEQVRRIARKLDAVVSVLKSGSMDPIDKIATIGSVLHLEARERLRKHTDPELGVRAKRTEVAASFGISEDSVTKAWKKLEDAGYWKRSETSWWNPEEGTGKKPHTETSVWFSVEGDHIERMAALAQVELPRNQGGKREKKPKVVCQNCGKTHIDRKVYTECQDCGIKWDDNSYDINERIEQENAEIEAEIERETLVASHNQDKNIETLPAAHTPTVDATPPLPPKQGRLQIIPPPVDGIGEFNPHEDYRQWRVN